MTPSFDSFQLICPIFLDVALTHDPGRGYGGSQHHHRGQRGRGKKNFPVVTCGGGGGGVGQQYLD